MHKNVKDTFESWLVGELLLVALLILYSDSRRVAYYLDAALVLAMLSFLATIAAARYRSEGEIF